MKHAIEVPAIPSDTPGLKRYVSAWIRHAVKRRPAVMRKVADRKLGNLHGWVTEVRAGGWCGCLIGATALVLNPRRVVRSGGCPEIVAKSINTTYNAEYTEEVGYAVSDLAYRLDGHYHSHLPTPRATAWIKRTIRAALRRRAAK